MLTRKTMFGGLAAVLLATGGTAGAVALAGSAGAAESTEVTVASSCHREPSGNPWPIVCLSDAYRYKAVCNLERTKKLNQGYGAWNCTNYGGSYRFYYGSS